MNAPNPHFNHIERAPYEFGHLIMKLPADFPAAHVMSSDERQQIEAAISHASNANWSLMNGLEAIGHLLFGAANNSDFPPATIVLEGIAGLIKHLAVEAQFLQEQHGNLQAILDTDDRRAATSPMRNKAESKASSAKNAGAV
ncbi:MAG TPA: hypothetical protein VF800_30530 [Telluria sp.]|jgi:hypothetical protein